MLTVKAPVAFEPPSYVLIQNLRAITVGWKSVMAKGLKCARKAQDGVRPKEVATMGAIQESAALDIVTSH